MNEFKLGTPDPWQSDEKLESELQLEAAIRDIGMNLRADRRRGTGVQRDPSTVGSIHRALDLLKQQNPPFPEGHVGRLKLQGAKHIDEAIPPLP